MVKAPTAGLVFASGFDPVGNGLVKSLEKPASNATGTVIEGPRGRGPA